MHHPSDADKVPAAVISVNVLRRRRSGFPVRRWMMGSGAFTTIAKHGDYPGPAADYAAEIRRWAGNGALMGPVCEDYMCEKVMLDRTGKSVAEHQSLTIRRYDDLLEAGTASVYVLPVLQGYAPQEYVEHIRQYGERLRPRMWVGVGSVCKRNARPGAAEAVLLAIKTARPDLRLHGFGVKRTALGSGLVRNLLFSADSMAWSFAARYEGRDANDPAEAVAYARGIKEMPVQLALGEW